MDKKQKILSSVLKLVNQEGFYHLNMKKIAQASGVAAGTIYLYFQGKEEMINAIYDQTINEYNNSIIEAYKEHQGLRENFENLLHAATQFYIDHEDKFSFIEQFTFSPFLFKENKKQNFNLLLPIFKLLTQGVKEGVIKPLPMEILISMIHGTMNTLLKLHFSNKFDLNDTRNRQLFYESIWSSLILIKN